MRLNPLISALICFLGACVAQATGGGIPDSKSLPPYAPYVQCVKEEADIILEAVVRIDGVFGTGVSEIHRFPHDQVLNSPE